MKSQLLEDMVDSQSSLSSPPIRRPTPAASPAAPLPAAPAQGGAARSRAGVWRARAPQAGSLWRPRPPAVVAPAPAPECEEAVTAPPADRPLPDWPPGRPEPSLAAPDIASFSSRQPDWAAPPQLDTTPWTERWGRKALGWSLALAGIAAVAGAGAWIVGETRVESSLAIVADHSAPPAPPAASLAPEPPMEEPPPLRLLPREEAVAAVAVAEPIPVPDVSAPPVIAAAPSEALPSPRPAAKKPAAKAPAAKRTPERRVAAAPARRDKPAPKKQATPKAPSERALARALADAQRSRQESLARPPAPQEATGTLAETLRLCRAAGYHANACMKRGCEATRFGLVCRG